MELIDFGLEEFDHQDGICTILCDFDQFGTMQEKLGNLSIEVKSAESHRIPNDTKNLSVHDALKTLNTIEKFEENDDVQKVFHTLNITDELISELNN